MTAQSRPCRARVASLGSASTFALRVNGPRDHAVQQAIAQDKVWTTRREPKPDEPPLGHVGSVWTLCVFSRS